MRFKDLSLKSKQIAAFGLILLMLAASTFFATTRMQIMKNDIDEVAEFWLHRAETIGSLAFNVALVRLNQVQMAATRDSDRRYMYAAAAIVGLDSVASYWDRLSAVRLDSLDRGLESGEQALAARENQLFEQLEDSWDTYLGELLFFLDPDEELDEDTRTRIFDESEDDFVAVSEHLGELIDLNEEAWEISERRADESFRSARGVMQFLFVGVIIVSIMIVGVLVRFVSKPVNELQRAAESVALGDRSIRIPLDSKDEVGSLAKSFNQMTAALQGQEAELLERQAETEQKNEALEAALAKLKATQQQLVVREKMASLGQLTAGIAHEIKNPLNFVNNFAKLSQELTHDLLTELKENESKTVREALSEIESIVSDLSFNAERIEEHGVRADSIVKNMLLHSRGAAGEKVKTDINQLLDQYVHLAYHGMRGEDSTFHAEMSTDYGRDVGEIEVVRQNLGRVFLNLLNNAFYAASTRSKTDRKQLTPKVGVQSRRLDSRIEIRISDNGPGIPQELIDKIFEPFFTTKPTGSGTGLGLSLAYDIITEEHGGEIEVETEIGVGTTFVISLPVQ